MTFKPEAQTGQVNLEMKQEVEMILRGGKQDVSEGEVIAVYRKVRDAISAGTPIEGKVYSDVKSIPPDAIKRMLS